MTYCLTVHSFSTFVASFGPSSCWILYLNLLHTREVENRPKSEAMFFDFGCPDRILQSSMVIFMRPFELTKKSTLTLPEKSSPVFPAEKVKSLSYI